MSTISQRLRQLREERKLKQEELALLLQCSRFSISNYENGRALTHDMVMAYATTFDVSTDWILGLSTQRKPGGNHLTERVDDLAALVHAKNGKPISSDQLAALIEKLIVYYQRGAPADNTPMQVLSAFLAALDATLDTLHAYSTVHVIDAANRIATAGLRAQDIVSAYVSLKEGKP